MLIKFIAVVLCGICSFTACSAELNETDESRVKQKIMRVKADLANSPTDKLVEQSVIKTIQVKVIELQDSKGLKYVGGEVSAVDLAVYLTQMKHILGDKFTAFRENQALRDHHTFHMTLVNPYELQALDKTMVVGETFRVSLQGLGRVEKGDGSTYFVVAQSSEAQFYRTKLGLSPKDFHVTLGFSPSDIYGVSKNIDSLIFEPQPEIIDLYRKKKDR